MIRKYQSGKSNLEKRDIIRDLSLYIFDKLKVSLHLVDISNINDKCASKKFPQEKLTFFSNCKKLRHKLETVDTWYFLTKIFFYQKGKVIQLI